MIDDKYLKITKTMLDGVEPIRKTGLDVVECRDWYARLRMPLKGNSNHIGIMYAGSLFTLGETAGGAVIPVAFDYNKYFAIVKDAKIRFKRPAMSDITMEVNMSKEEADRIVNGVEEKEKCDFVLELELKDINNDVVAVMSGTWQARKIPPGMKLPWTD